MENLASPHMNHLQSEMHYGMIEAVKERNQGYEVVLLERFFDIRTLKYPTIIGTFGWTCPALMTKWLHQPFAINVGGGYETPGDIARDYIALKFPNRKPRVTSSQWQACIGERGIPPIFCIPSEFENGAYLDLTSAYWSILKVVGWDVNYNPGKWLSVNSDVLDFPYPHLKMARNCLVSMGLTNDVRNWDGMNLTLTRKPSKFINWVLWRLVADVLNGVATEMVQAGAVYVYTDGYIFPDDKVKDAFEIAESWGLPLSIKNSGKTIVKAAAAYQVGDKTSKPFTTTRRNIPSDKVDKRPFEFLKKRFKRFADISKHKWEIMYE